MSAGLVGRDLGVDVASRTLLDGVDCEVVPGRMTVLLGPNGAGKSTLLRVLAGTAIPTRGEVTWGGDRWLGIARRTRARIAALVEQDAHAELPLTVESVVGLGRIPHGTLFGGGVPDDARVVASALATLGLGEFRTRAFDTLSGGERQRVHLARALAQQPRLLLLDEPTNHLDVASQLATLELTRELAHRDGVAVIAALHDLNLAAAFADDLLVLANGRVVASGPPALVLTPGLIHDVYGVDALVLDHPRTGRPLIAY